MNRRHPPLVSVVIRTKNRSSLLQRCLETINGQTYPCLEVVIINDGGSDVSGVLPVLRFPYVYVHLPCSVGRGYCLNAGWRNAKGDYLNFLDDDDVLYPEHIGTLMDTVFRTGAQVVYADSLLRTEQFIDGEWQAVNKELQYSQNYDPQALLRTNYLPILNVLFRKELAEQAGGANEGYAVLEDWDFWIRLSLIAHFVHIPLVTAEYSQRIGGDNATQLEAHLFPAVRERIHETYRKYWT